MAPWTHDGEQPRLLVQPQVIPSSRGHIWLTGLVASPRVIDVGLVIELGDGSRNSRATDSVPLPVSPQVHITSQSGEPLQGFHAGSEGGHKGAIFVHRHEWWNPTALPRECILHIRQDELGIAFSAGFLNES
jgi:hypothetical protein